MVMNCHTQNLQTIVTTLTKLMVTNCHTQNAQPIVITFTKLWSWTVILRMRKQFLLLWLNYGDELSHSECATNCYYFDQINGDELSHSECTTWLLLLWPNYGDELPHSECVTNCYYLNQINGAELWHSECTTNCYYFDQIMVTNCHTENVETIVIILTKLMVTNCHTQNTQPIAITFTKLWSWTVILRMRKQLLLLWLNYGDKLSHSRYDTNTIRHRIVCRIGLASSIIFNCLAAQITSLIRHIPARLSSKVACLPQLL